MHLQMLGFFLGWCPFFLEVEARDQTDRDDRQADRPDQVMGQQVDQASDDHGERSVTWIAFDHGNRDISQHDPYTGHHPGQDLLTQQVDNQVDRPS
ncbi:hypothetical protein [Hutsoniella sourekii]|uniref:hypothetical protein n=1 Tax=Hutsoniella sourekii TaxID=87650 RepID=UPI002E1FC07A